MAEVEWGLFEKDGQKSPVMIGRPHITRESADHALFEFSQKYPNNTFKLMVREVGAWLDATD